MKNNAIAALLLASAFVFAGIFLASEKLIVLAVPAFIAPFAIRHFYPMYMREKRAKEIEDGVPDALLLASSMPGNYRFESALDFIAKNSSGPLREEFIICQKEILAGMPVEEALARTAERNESASLKRAIGLMVSALESGADMAAAFRETAEDFMETNSLIRERQAATALQKYTLIIAAGVVVPFILGKLFSMAKGFSMAGISDAIGGISELQRNGLLSAAGIGNIAYVAELAIIASIFIGFHEGAPKKSVVYALFLLPAGLAAYFLSSGSLLIP